VQDNTNIEHHKSGIKIGWSWEALKVNSQILANYQYTHNSVALYIEQSLRSEAMKLKWRWSSLIPRLGDEKMGGGLGPINDEVMN